MISKSEFLEQLNDLKKSNRKKILICALGYEFTCYIKNINIVDEGIVIKNYVRLSPLGEEEYLIIGAIPWCFMREVVCVDDWK